MTNVSAPARIAVQPASPLLRLPGEVLNIIYQYVLDTAQPVHLAWPDGVLYPPPTSERLSKLHPKRPLNEICRQVRSETMNMTAAQHRIQPFCYTCDGTKDRHGTTVVRGYHGMVRDVDGLLEDFAYASVCFQDPPEGQTIIVFSSALSLEEGISEMLVAAITFRFLFRGVMLPSNMAPDVAEGVDYTLRCFKQNYQDFRSYSCPDAVRLFPMGELDAEKIRASPACRRSQFERELAGIKSIFKNGI